YRPGPPPGFPPPRPRSSRMPFVLGGVALLVVLAIVVTVVVVVNRNTGDPVVDPSPSVVESGSPAASASPSEGPDENGVYGDKMIHAGTGLYFTMIDSSDWQAGVPEHAEADEFVDPVGQYVDLGSGNYAVAQIGEVRDDFTYTGPEDLESVKTDLVSSILKNHYFDGAEKDTKVQDEALSQYGHKSWLWAYHVTYSGSSEASGESVVIAVLDVGDGRAAAFWGTVPDGHNGLITDMTDAAGTLNFRA
ncbi:MAG: hypothetical protein WCA46_21650, partial [Actinocatenispora sp.]